MTKHTPLPWEIVWERDKDHAPPKRAESIGPVSADHDHWSGWTICDEADAEFIVRACNTYDDLLAALEELADTVSDYPLGRATGSDVADAIGKARDAIDKAKVTA